ncbi:MAG TPA: class E sortase [Rubrobacteraceae bacterium]|nr:class E sortase [Rubrobacteraceae bacterium]
MRKFSKSRLRRTILSLLSLALVVAGVALIASYFLMQEETTATNSNNPQGFNVPKISSTQQPDIGGPEDKTLTLTIPKMSHVENASVPYTSGDDEPALKEHAAIHLEGTGFPWQPEANVYLAGHRIGYPGYSSFLAFYDLDKLENGDEVMVTDANDTTYTYRVFKTFVADPSDLSVTETVPGRNVVTLQTCTLPDYAQRLMVQAELVNKT